MKLFYNSTFNEDMIAICAYMDEFLGSFGLDHAQIDQNKIEAELNNGILTITLPVAEEAKAREMSIS